MAFYPGAKIGLVGDNGSGKSTLLRIMAGLDRKFKAPLNQPKKMRAVLVAQEPVLDLGEYQGKRRNGIRSDFELDQRSTINSPDMASLTAMP